MSAVAAIAVSFVSLVVAEPAHAESGVTYSFTDSTAGFASLDVLMGSEVTSNRKVISEVRPSDWGYTDGTNIGPVKGGPYGYDPRFTLVRDRYSSSPPYQANPITGNGDSRLPTTGSIYRISIYDDHGVKIPNAAFRARFEYQDNFDVWHDQDSGIMRLYSCDPSVGSSCTPVAAADTIEGTNPVTSSPLINTFKTNSSGVAYLYVDGGQWKHGDRVTLYDYRDGDSDATNLGDDRIFHSVKTDFVYANVGPLNGHYDSVANKYAELKYHDFDTSTVKSIPAQGEWKSGVTAPSPLFPTYDMGYLARSEFKYVPKSACLWGATVPDPAASAITASPTSITADGTSTSTVTVQLRSMCGSNLAKAGTDIYLDIPGADGTWSNVKLTTDATGKATATVTSSTTLGKDTVTAYVGTDSTGSKIGTVDVAYVPGPADASKSSISVTKSKIEADGSSTTDVQMTVLDATGNVVTEGTEVCLVRSDGAGDIAVGPYKTDKDGKVSATVTAPSVVGTGTFSGYFGPCDNKGAKVGDVTVDYVPGNPATGKSSFIGNEPTNVADGTDSNTVTVTVKDANGNPVALGTKVCLLVATGDGTLSAGPWSTDANGQVSATLTSKKAGIVNVDSYVGPCDDKGGKVGTVATTFTPGDPDELGSEIGSEKLTLTANGSSNTNIMMVIRDKYRNPVVPGTPICLVLTDGTGTLSEGPWSTDVNGMVVASLTSGTDAGSGTVTAYACGGEVPVQMGAVTVAYVSAPIDDGGQTSGGGDLPSNKGDHTKGGGHLPMTGAPLAVQLQAMALLLIAGLFLRRHQSS